ncbi:unnamed protein product, partial [Ixodes pacificus]
PFNALCHRPPLDNLRKAKRAYRRPAPTAVGGRVSGQRPASLCHKQRDSAGTAAHTSRLLRPLAGRKSSPRARAGFEQSGVSPSSRGRGPP